MYRNRQQEELINLWFTMPPNSRRPDNLPGFVVHCVPVHHFAFNRGLCTSINQRSRATRRLRLRMEERSPRRPRKGAPRKPSTFETTIDDLTMKRLGRGSQYYGERPVLEDVDDSSVDDFLKPDPVLVTGGTGRTGQWIALGLLNQGFNVRCLTRNFDKAESIFGPSGSNLDVFQGDVTRATGVYEAVEGSIAVVCASGAPWWLIGGHPKVDIDGVQNLVDAAKKAGSVRRFVLISCADNRGSRALAKRAAEKVVMESGIPYVIFRAAPLSNEEGGLKNIILSTDEERRTGASNLSRIDLAQSVCQALVYERSLSQLREEDPDTEFDFPSCVIHIENNSEPYVPINRFWKKEFTRISQAYRGRADPEAAAT